MGTPLNAAIYGGPRGGSSWSPSNRCSVALSRSTTGANADPIVRNYDLGSLSYLSQ
jgi:hypothetical protein